MSADDLRANDVLEEELCAVEAIFGEDCTVSSQALTVSVPSKDAKPCLLLTLHFPAGYPQSEAPLVELRAEHLSDDQQQCLVQELQELWLPGEVVAFNMVELLRERHEVWQERRDGNTAENDLHSDQADKLSLVEGSPAASRSNEEQQLMDVMAARLVTGEPYTERKSTFQAHVAAVETVEQVDAMMAVLLQDGKVRRASHNMLAYRIAVPDKATYLQDYDDDGETAAGSRMLHLLQVADVTNVCVCVSRWFGGVHLGPSRFTIINNTARALLVAQGFMPEGKSRSKARK